MFSVSPVPTHEIDSVWPYILPYIHNLQRRSEGQLFDWGYDENKLKHLLRTRQVQLWVGWLQGGQIIGFTLTQLQMYKDHKVCEIFAASGEEEIEKDWNVLITVIEDWAENVEGCDAVLVNGRIGWNRVLKPSGYTIDSVQLIKVFDDEDHDTTSASVEYKY